MPEQSESHNRKADFLKRRDPFSEICCRNTTPSSRAAVEGRFYPEMFAALFWRERPFSATVR
jgi:hypothetical protein